MYQKKVFLSSFCVMCVQNQFTSTVGKIPLEKKKKIVVLFSIENMRDNEYYKLRI